MKKTTVAWLTAGTIFGASALSVLAHGGATGIVAERMNGMMMLGEQVKALRPMLAGEAEVDPSTVATAAAMITDHSGTAMLELFPEGSVEGPSVAKQVIWDNWSEFEDLAERLAELGDELGDAILVPAAAAEPEVTEPELSEWEKLDADLLLGVKTRERRMAELSVVATPPDADEVPPPRRAPEEVFADIAATCSSCHSAFRR